MNTVRLFFYAVETGDYTGWNDWYGGYLKTSDEAVMILPSHDFSGGDFTSACFRSAKLCRCYAQRAVFADADLSGMCARLSACCGAVFRGANRDGATFPAE